MPKKRADADTNPTPTKPESADDVSQASASGLGEYRRAQLIADLRLTPEERVRAAEATARVSELLRPARRGEVLQFENYEDYLDWKERREL